MLDAAASIAHVQLAAGSAVRVVPAGYQSRQRVGELTIVSGPGAGTTVPLERSVIVIGRDPACDVVLDDPLVSKRHARLEIGQGRVELVDLNSANGTKVNGTRIPPQQDVPLKRGDRVEIGSKDECFVIQ